MDDNEFALRKFVAPEFVFGMDARKLAGRYTRNFGGRKVLVVTDPGVVAAGWLDDILSLLREEQLEYAVYDAVTCNPKAHEVAEGADFYHRQGCNSILAVGGGSPMDCAKGIGIVSSNDGDIVAMEGVDRVELPVPPLICVPTTAGSSADVSQFAIITDTVREVKIAIISKMIVPDVALIDPITTTTMSTELTAGTGIDALCHAIEAYVSTAHSPITDVHALQAIRLIATHLPQVLEAPQNLTFRGRVMLASLEAGLAFSNASLGAVHAMSHSVGGLRNAPHGECNAIILPHVVQFNFEAAPERFGAIAEAMRADMEGKEPTAVLPALLDALHRLTHRCGLNKTLAEMGVQREDLSMLAGKAMHDPCIFTNPRQPTAGDIEAIYAKAF